MKSRRSLMENSFKEDLSIAIANSKYQPNKVCRYCKYCRIYQNEYLCANEQSPLSKYHWGQKLTKKGFTCEFYEVDDNAVHNYEFKRLIQRYSQENRHGCINCAYCAWMVGIGQGVACCNPKSPLEYRNGRSGFKSVPFRFYICDEYQIKCNSHCGRKND